MASRSPWTKHRTQKGGIQSPISIFFEAPYLSRIESFRPDSASLLIWRSCIRGGNLLDERGTAVSTQPPRNQDGAAPAGPSTHGH